MHLGGIELSATQAMQQILDLIERLHGRGWIIDGRRQRPDGNIDQQAYRYQDRPGR
jgi:hypothetical protein